MPNLALAPNLGRHWLKMDIALCTEDEVAGSYTIGTYSDFKGSVIEFDEESLRELQNVVAATVQARNPVQIDVGTRCTVREYLSNTNAGANYESVLKKFDVTGSLVALRTQMVTGGLTMVLIARIGGGTGNHPREAGTYQLTMESVALAAGAPNPAFS